MTVWQSARATPPDHCCLGLTHWVSAWLFAKLTMLPSARMQTRSSGALQCQTKMASLLVVAASTLVLPQEQRVPRG